MRTSPRVPQSPAATSPAPAAHDADERVADTGHRAAENASPRRTEPLASGPLALAPAARLDPTGFSPSYAAARARFLAAADRVGGHVHSEPLDPKGPDGEELAIDFARVGPERASRVVVVSSGTHGVEGFLGSAIQTRWLEEHAASGGAIEPATDTAVLMIHAVNPYGFAWRRRANEENVDLNRNCLSSDERYEGQPPKLDVLAKLLDPRRPPRRLERLPLARLAWTILRHGSEPLKQALVTGQYERPDMLFFGGKQPSASMKILESTLPALLGDPDRAVHIDIHSGLGPRGEFTLLLEPVYSEERLGHLKRFVPNLRIEGAGGENLEVTYAIRGGLLAWCSRLLDLEDYRPMTAECGTYSRFRVLEALYLENLAHRYGSPGMPGYRRAKRRICEAFAPEDPRWRRKVSDRGIWLVERAVTMAAD